MLAKGPAHSFGEAFKKLRSQLLCVRPQTVERPLLTNRIVAVYFRAGQTMARLLRGGPLLALVVAWLAACPPPCVMLDMFRSWRGRPVCARLSIDGLPARV